MKRPATFFPIVLALGAMILAPRIAQAQSSQEGPVEIEKCRTIDQPGSYRLVRNLTSAFNANCLVISANFVTIDLAGFTITSGGGNGAISVAGITTTAESPGQLRGIAVRNGSISNFLNGVDLSLVDGIIVEGLRVSCGTLLGGPGIDALLSTAGIIKGNTVTSCEIGIDAAGVITGNTVSFVGVPNNGVIGITALQGSTVIGNTITNNGIGISAVCPSNVTDNTAVNNSSGNLVLNGDGCNNTNNVAP